MPTECSPTLFEFAPAAGRAVVAGFDGGAITSDAGALLLGATDRAIGLVTRFATCFADARDPDRIEHAIATLVGQRVFGIALGYEDLIDHDQLRRDPALAILAGKLAARRAACAPLAGKSTLNRLERAPAGGPGRYHRIGHDGTAIEVFAGRASAATMRANQLRLWFAAMAYVLLCALRRIGLAHTQFAEATCGTLRLALLKVGALVRISVRRIKVAMASAHPHQNESALAHARLAAAAAA
jgi:Transposase DDE domain group 1